MKPIILSLAALLLSSSSCTVVKMSTHRELSSIISDEVSPPTCDDLEVSSRPPVPRTFGLEGRTQGSAAATLIGDVLKVFSGKLGTAQSCGKLKNLVDVLALTSVGKTWDDYVMVTFLTRHLALATAEEKKFFALGVASEMASGFKVGDHNHFASSGLERNFDSLVAFDTEWWAINFRNAFVKLSLEVLVARGVNGYEGIRYLAPAEQESAAQEVASAFADLFRSDLRDRNIPETRAKSFEYVKYCDQKLAQIFGGTPSVAVNATGWDRVEDKKLKILGGYNGSANVHVISAMHVYSEAERTNDEQLLYLPASCAKSPGTGRKCRSGKNFKDATGKCLEYSESLMTSCSSLGRFPGRVGIAAAHVANQNRSYSQQKNSFGSIPVGYLAGSGGEGGHGYGHSHLQATSQGFRLSFSDAFCR